MKGHLSITQVLAFTAILLVLASCSLQDIEFESARGYYAAYVRVDGKIVTAHTTNPLSAPWQHVTVHPEQSLSGPSIAANTDDRTVALAFFTPSMRGNRLIVKTGLAPAQWESDTPSTASIAAASQSAVSMTHLNGGFFFLAWNDGARIKSALFNSRTARLTELNPIANVPNVANIHGAPSVAFNGTVLRMIWRARFDEGSHFSAVGRFDGVGSVSWMENPGMNFQAEPNSQGLAFDEPFGPVSIAAGLSPPAFATERNFLLHVRRNGRIDIGDSFANRVFDFAFSSADPNTTDVLNWSRTLVNFKELEQDQAGGTSGFASGFTVPLLVFRAATDNRDAELIALNPQATEPLPASALFNWPARSGFKPSVAFYRRQTE